MTTQDSSRWDAVYRDRPPQLAPTLPDVFTAHEAQFPVSGTALEIACGLGAASVWLARRGLDVHGVDVSAAAIDGARALADSVGVAARCRFGTVDLDVGLPPGDPVDVVLCHRFRDPRLYRAIVDRLAPGGLLAICVLSEVGAAPGRFRSAPGELTTAFAALERIDSGEGDGQAWLLARA